MALPRRISQSVLLALALCAPAPSALALPSYDDVLVVINVQSPESVEAGRYFQHQRRIPERNVCTISIPPRLNDEHMTVAERDAAVTAIRAHLDSNGLLYRINHVVLTPRIAYFSDNDMVAAYYDMGDHIFDLYLMFMLSDPGVDIFSLNPFYHYVNGNWDNLKEHSFSRRKYGYPIVTRLDGPGTANIRNMIDATGAPAYQSYTNGINFLVSYSNDADIYRSTANARGAEFIRRGNIRLNEDFFTTPKGSADEPVMDESAIMFAYFNLVNEAGVDDPPFTFWGLNFLPGSMLTAWRSFPTRKLLRTSGGVSRVTVASKAQTEFRREDGADYAYRHLETIAVDPVRNRVWAGSGEKQENVWHQFGIYTHQRRGNGLAVLDAGSGALIAHYTQRNSGLLNDRVVKLAYDRQADRLWVASYGGIQYVDLTDNSFHAVAGLTADYAAAYDVYVSPYDTGKVYASFLYEGTATRNSTVTDARIKLFEIDKPTGAVTALSLGSANGFRPLIAQTAPGTLWNVRDKTLVRYDRATQQAITTVDLAGVLAPDSSDYPRALLAHTNSFGERQVFVALANALSTPAPQRKNYLVRLVETGPNTLTTNVINLAAWNDTSASANGQSVYIRHLAADPQNPNHIYMALSKQHDNTSTHYGLIMRSTDGRGTVWEPYIASSPTLQNLNEIAFDGQGNLFCARGYHNNGQGNVSDFMAFGACAVGGGLDHDYMLYNRARVAAGLLNVTWADPNEATRVMAGAATNAYTAGDINYPMGPVMFKVLDGFGCAASRFSAYKQYPATGGGGHTPFMLVMEPKVAPFAPRPDEAGTLLRTGPTNALSVRLVSPGLPAHMDGFSADTINADTVALFDNAGTYLEPGAITYVVATREVLYQRPGMLTNGIYYLRLKGGAGGIKNTQGGALTNPRADEFRDDIVLRYTVGGTPGNVAPHVDAGPDQSVVWPQQRIFLTGSVSDDRQPSPFPSVLWSKLSGPGIVAFSSPGTALTHATFSTPGTYILRLAADDGDLAATSDVVVTVQSQSIPSGLVAHWSFEEAGGLQADDVSGHANNATLRGGVTRGAGRLGKGLACDGRTGHVDAGASEAFNLTERLTLSAWVYVESAPSAFRGRTVASRLGVGRSAAAGAGWNLGAESGDNALSFTVRDREGVRTTVRAEGFFTEQHGRWAHVVGVFEGGRSVALYVNGALAQRTTDEVPAFLSYEPGTLLTLGRKSTGGDTLHGRLDDVRLYGHALGASEIAALHETGIAANAAPTVNAGADITITWPTNSVLLAGTVADDGQPVLPDRPSVRWSQSGGSGTATFASTELTGTYATFSQIGTYELQLDATDGELAASDRMTVTVQAPPVGGYTNFALNQPASAYSRRIVDGIDYNAAKAVDGNRTGVTNKWWTNNEITPRWFQVGLGGFQTINEVRLDCQDLTGSVGTLYDFQIRLHRGAEGYATVCAVTNNSAPTVICHFEPTVCSNVYVSITRNATDIFLYELEAYYKELAPGPVASTPTVALAAPADATVMTWGQDATLTATVADPSNLATRVEFYAGALKLGEDTTDPYGFTWVNPQSGVHALRARMVDIYGRESLSTVRTLTVNRPPAATWLAPADGAVFLQGEPIILEVAASDPDAEVVAVAFLADGSPLGSSGSPPYVQTWTGAGLGTHALRAVAADAYGASGTSAVLTVAVSATNIAPAILSSPTNLTVLAGQPAHFEVRATGTLLGYQWYRNGQVIAGANGASYKLAATGTNDHGATFRAMVTNAAGSATSASADLSVVANGPTIVTQPAGRAVIVGADATFEVVAQGGGQPLGYQWLRDGEVLAGATLPSYTVADAAEGHNGRLYCVVVSNEIGGVTSATALLTVAAGTVHREVWTGIAGGVLTDLTGHTNFPDRPSGSSYETLFETPSAWTNSYGTRMRGYVHPPVSGEYGFWVAADDSCELWLSTDEAPSNKVRIAYCTTPVASREWGLHPSQQSGPITLQAGKRYYIEALQKEDAGDDHLAVGWQLPDGTFERPISGLRLSPYSALSGRWPLGEGAGSVASDATAYTNHAALVNAAWFADSTMGSVLTCNGTTSGSVATCPLSPVLDITGELTVSAWVYAAEPPTTQGRTAVSRYRYAAGAETGWNLGAVWTGTSFGFSVSDGLGNTKSANLAGFFTSKLNGWHHMVGVYRPGAAVRLYMDGALVSEVTAGVPAVIAYSPLANDPLRIGRRSADAQSHWSGSISDVRLYRQALSTDGIGRLYQEGFPVIVAQPASATVEAGAAVAFAVRADGAGPFVYQWLRDGTVVPGATAARYALAAASEADDGATYHVRISNGVRVALSDAAVLTILRAPTILAQPEDQSVTSGEMATFGVAAGGSAPLFYQWYRDGNPIADATGATYSIPVTVLADDASRFSVAIFNAADWVASGEALLTVHDASRHALPYRESFERFADGFALPGFDGWRGADGVAQVSADSAALPALLAYDAAVGYPLRHEAHAQVAVFGNALANALAAPSGTAVWCDLMAELTRAGGALPPPASDLQCALSLDADGRLNVWHRDLDGGTNRWSALAWQTAQTAVWARVTLHLDYATHDAVHDARYFRLYVDGAEQGHAQAYTANDGAGAPGGTWFALSATAPDGIDALFFDGVGTLDDLVVDTARPLIGVGPLGTPEWWLADHGLTNGLSLAENELEDADDDGFPNWKEHGAGTGPNDPGSLLRVTDLPVLANGRLALAVQTVPGRRYALEGSGDLAAGAWEPAAFALAPDGEPAVQTATASAESLTFHVETAAPFRVYRVRVESAGNP